MEKVSLALWGIKLDIIIVIVISWHVLHGVQLSPRLGIILLSWVRLRSSLVVWMPVQLWHRWTC